VEARQIISIVRTWLWLIVATSVIGGIAGLAVSYRQPQTYRATTTLYVSSLNHSDYSSLLGDQEAAKAYALFPQSGAVLQAALNAVGDHRLSLTQLASMVSVQYQRQTQFVAITVSDSDAARASRLASEIATQSTALFQNSGVTGHKAQQFVAQELTALASTIGSLETQVGRSASRSNRANELNARLNADRALYSQLLGSYNAMNSTQVLVVQAATSSAASVSLRRVIALVMGLLAGAIVGVGMLLLMRSTTEKVVEVPEFDRGLKANSA